MSVRIWNVRDWTKLPGGEVIPFEAGQRRIALEVNTSAPFLWYIDEGEGPKYIGKTDGLDKLVFNVEGACEVYGNGLNETEVEEVWFWTLDGKPVAKRYEDSESFLNAMSRAERSPEEERAMVTMFANSKRNEEKLAKTRADAEAAIAAVMAELEVERKKAAAAEAKAAKAAKAEEKPDENGA